MNGKTVLITGAGGGMGEAGARLFAKEGYNVVVVDVNGDNAKLVADKLVQDGYSAISIACDVSNETEVETMVQKAVDTYGSLDAAYNNAGILHNYTPSVDLSTETFDRVINVNLKGVWLCMKYELKQMLKQGKGAIVNTSSAAGIVGIPGLTAYGASKHGVIGLTKCVGTEYVTKGIRVNAICPGGVDTPMTRNMPQDDSRTPQEIAQAFGPSQRMAAPEEIAAMALWLCSDAASYVTGQAIAVDGGMTTV